MEQGFCPVLAGKGARQKAQHAMGDQHTFEKTNMGDNWYWLVVEPYPSEKYESQLGLLFPSYEK